MKITKYLLVLLLISNLAHGGILKKIFRSKSKKAKLEISEIKIGLSNSNLGAPYYIALSENIKRSARENGIKEIITTNADNDMLKQITDIEGLINSKVDVLIINPKDPKAILKSTEAAAKAKIPVFIIDSGISDEAEYVSYIGCDNVVNSQLLGEYIAEKFSDEKIYAGVISGNKGNAVGKTKRSNFFSGLSETQLEIKDNTDYEIVLQKWGAWNEEAGKKAAKKILDKVENVNLIYAENDSMALGAIEELKERNMLSKVTVIGFDGQKEGYEAIIAGEMEATAINSPRVIAETTIDTIIKHLSGGQVEKRIVTPPAVITKSNVNNFYREDSIF